MAVVHLPINIGVDICIQSRVIDISLKFKTAAAAILDFQFIWIWPFRRVDSVVFMLCAKFGSNICYSHWDRRTYAEDIHLMTSRELTSGFDFWSRGHLRHIIWCKISSSSPKLLTFFRFEPSLVQVWRTVRPVALAKKPKKKEKKTPQTVANWLFAQTTHVAVSKSKFACRVVRIRCAVLYFKFY